jgi:WD40 repeat protein
MPRARGPTSPQVSTLQQPTTHHPPIAVVESLLFHHPIADHSFSADRQTLAVARENNVDLFQKTGSGYKLKDELTGHDKTVTGVDIAPNSGKIVTCSQGKFGAI